MISGKKLKRLVKKLPKNYYFCQNALWVGGKKVDIDHIDNNLSNELDYEKAIRKMLSLLEN